VTILAVDLAAKYSAACLMGDDYTVVKQFDSWQISEDAFIQTAARFLDDDRVHAADVDGHRRPPARPAIFDPRQNRVSAARPHITSDEPATIDGHHEDMLYVAPATWRAHYEGMQRGTGPEIVVPVAERYGYTPPDFTERAKGNGGKTRAKKVATDYCSAYLIARWAIDVNNEHATFDVPGTSRYYTTVIRKKDFDDQDR
jgi:hypothetical protein